MIKNFTKENEEHILSIVREVTPDGFFEHVGDFFGDIGLTVSGWFGNLDIGNYVDNMDEYHNKILDKKNATEAQIRKIFSNVREDDTQYGAMQTAIRESTCDPAVQYLRLLISSLGDGTTPINVDGVIQPLNALKALLKESRIDVAVNPAYASDPPYYGGRQHGCITRWDSGEEDFKVQAREIMHKYYSDYNDTQIRSYLDEMNNHGCHYMAAVNTIFAQFIGREDEFEEKFGFPMYDENGHVNSDLVMLDFYARQCSIDGKHNSLEPSEINKQWGDYLAEKDIHVEVKKIDMDINDYHENAKNGEIIIRYSPLRLRNHSGQMVDNRNGGHATVITGVEVINGKKMYKVTSWGEAYWIDPDDYKDISGSPIFEQVIYS